MKLSMWIIIIICGAALAISLQKPKTQTPIIADSDVKVIAVNAGHGSGVHIGGGYIVTAAHVLGGDTTYKVLDKSGSQWAAEILWKNTTYDIGLIRIANANLPVPSLDCVTRNIGERLVSRGNPFEVEFIETRGIIASKIQNMGKWKEAQIADISIAPGMSGGPVYGDDGRIVGINVGIRTLSFGFSASLTGLGVIVPASTVCKLMGRA